MNRQIKWESGCYDEIELIYEKAENDEEFARILKELEQRAISEARNYCKFVNTGGEPLTTEKFDKLSLRQKERVIWRLGEGGIAKINASIDRKSVV